MTLNKKSKIAVLFGGISLEREISLRSGNNCFAALKRKGYENAELVDIKSIDEAHSLKTKNIDFALLTTHGKYGEDGALQGILEWLKIPYTGSSILASAIAMDKWITKQIAKNIGLSCAKAFLLTNKNKKSLNTNKIWSELSKSNGAVFVKPKDDGSSLNTFKIKSEKELSDKINEIDLATTDYLIEEYIKGREITVSIIDLNGALKVLPILELKPKNEFYDYEAKYTKGMTEFILPAPLNEKLKNRIEEESIKIFNEIGCSSFGRVDFIISEDETPYLLELNLLPGMTDTSDLPAQAKAAGIDYDELVEIIIKSAKLHK